MEEDGIYYFPEDAVKYYNLNDTIRFHGKTSDDIHTFPICSRDTMLSIFEWRDFCGKEDYHYSIQYDLSLDSCGTATSFLCSVAPDTTIEVIWNLDDGTRFFFKNNYGSGQVGSQIVAGMWFQSVYELMAYSYSSSILFSLEYGIIQYTTYEDTFNIIRPESLK